MALNSIRDLRLTNNQQSPNPASMVVGQVPQELSTNQHSSNDDHEDTFVTKESGLVEKLMHSYGFIQYGLSNQRIFFHFSEYNGDISMISIGDAVEFYISYDERTGRPVAVGVAPVLAAFVPSCTVSKEQMNGMVLVEPKSTDVTHSVDRSGRISYERAGECFFIPYSTLDLADDDDEGAGGEGSAESPKQGDAVTFYVATDSQKGNVWATCVQKVAPVNKTYQGVICSLKENFGFIERSDVVKEIFFHYTEYSGNIAELSLGDDVEYTIQTRNGKEVASGVRLLVEGTVIFEDVNETPRRGKILKVIKPNKKACDPPVGCIVYETLDGPVEIPFHERDLLGEFTTFAGDIVQFNVATDRRDKMERATNIKLLLDESVLVSKEKRDRGVVTSLKESYGFAQMCSSGEQLFFHFSELTDGGGASVIMHDELEFTVAHDQANKSKPIAIRVKRLQKAQTDASSTVSAQTYLGIVAPSSAAGGRLQQGRKVAGEILSGGCVIKYTYNDKEQTLAFANKSNEFKSGDKVFFNVSERKSDGSRRAVNVKSANSVEMHIGYVIILKENYGFIETLSLDDEIFFHFTCYQGEKDDIEIGTIVEYVLVRRNKKVYAENVKKLRNTSVMDIVDGSSMMGKVVRSVRTGISDQEQYAGLVQVEATGQGEPAMTYSFGIMSLQNKRGIPAVGDTVQFQLAKVKATGDMRAANVSQLREPQQGKVESVKGQQCVIEYDDGKKAFCQQQQLATAGDGGMLHLQAGDMVEFYLAAAANGGVKPLAVGVRRSQCSARPERLISRLKNQTEAGPRVTHLRQPRGPDGSRGFNGTTTATTPTTTTATNTPVNTSVNIATTTTTTTNSSSVKVSAKSASLPSPSDVD